MLNRGFMSVVVVCGSLLGGACGGSDADPVAAENYFDEAFKLTCERAFDCCTQSELDAQFGTLDPQPTNVEECIAAYGAFAALIEPDFLASIEAGRTNYDADKAGACFDAARGLACAADLDADLPDCATIVTPKVALGGACSQSEECIGDASCVTPDGAELGECAAQAAIGEACASVECVDTAFCDFIADACVAKKANGEACAGSYECDSDYCDDTSSACAAEPVTCDGV